VRELNILIVDDEPDVRRSLRKRLEKVGHCVVEAADGRAAAEQARTTPPDLVITDIIMPDTDGIETIATLRQNAPHLRILAISGGGRTGRTDFLQYARKLGADDILAKPFSSDTLHAKVDALADGLETVGTVLDSGTT